MRFRALPAVMALSIAAACGGDATSPVSQAPTVPVQITVNADTLWLAPGESQTITATVTGSTNKGVSFTSSNTGIATVSSNGVVTATARGIAVVTATSVADPSKAANLTTKANGITSGFTAKLNGQMDELVTYSIVVPAGATQLRVTTSGGTGDADLYLNNGPFHPGNVSSCFSNNDFNEETCQVPNPAAQRWHIVVRGYTFFNDVTFTATITP